MKPRFIVLTRDGDGQRVLVNPAQICWMHPQEPTILHGKVHSSICTAASEHPRWYYETVEQIQALIDEAYSPDTPAPDAPWKRMMSDIVARSCGESDAVGYGPKSPYGIKFTYPNQPPEWVEMAMAQDPITGQAMFWHRSTREWQRSIVPKL